MRLCSSQASKGGCGSEVSPAAGERGTRVVGEQHLICLQLNALQGGIDSVLCCGADEASHVKPRAVAQHSTAQHSMQRQRACSGEAVRASSASRSDSCSAASTRVPLWEVGRRDERGTYEWWCSSRAPRCLRRGGRCLQMAPTTHTQAVNRQRSTGSRYVLLTAAPPLLAPPRLHRMPPLQSWDRLQL